MSVLDLNDLLLHRLDFLDDTCCYRLLLAPSTRKFNIGRALNLGLNLFLSLNLLGDLANGEHVGYVPIINSANLVASASLGPRVRSGRSCTGSLGSSSTSAGFIAPTGPVGVDLPLFSNHRTVPLRLLTSLGALCLFLLTGFFVGL